MKRYLILSLLLALPSVALAGGEEVDCAAQCDDGKTMVSHADGNSVSCRCTDAAEMVPTSEDPTVEGTNEDAGQGHD